MKGIKRYYGQTATSVITTDILVNAGARGQSVIVLASDHGDIGDATFSGVYLVRCGYDGNHVSSSIIAETNGGTSMKTFTVSHSNGYVTLSGYRAYMTIQCKVD